jgi:hypothetical protein
MIGKDLKMSLKSALLMSFLLVLLIGPSLCSATEVWSEDFEGNPPLDEWEINPSATVVDGCLRGDGQAFGAYRPCNISSGAWSLDVLAMGEWGLAAQTALNIYFMSTDPALYPQTYYCLKIVQGAVAAGLKYIYSIVKGDGGSATTLASGDGYEGSELNGVLQHIRVTRSPTGHMMAYVNDSLMVEATDNDITTSEYFWIFETYDYAIDNIVVDDAFQPEIPFVLAVIGVGVVAIVVVIAVLVMRRR